MPLKYKILLSAIVICLSAWIAWSEFAADADSLGWIVVAIGSIMLLGLWVFPEAGGGKPARREER